MKINQKVSSGFLVVGLLILVVTYVNIIIHEDLTRSFREVAGEVLPCTIEAVNIKAELSYCEKHAHQYGLTGNLEDKKTAKDSLAALEEHVAAHRLYHSGSDDPKVIQIIDERVETFINFVTEYILLKDNTQQLVFCN